MTEGGLMWAQNNSHIGSFLVSRRWDLPWQGQGGVNTRDWLRGEGQAGSSKSGEPEESPRPVLLVSHK